MKIFMNVGDASADFYAANLAKELKVLDPSVELSGNGGALMQGAGVKILNNLVDLSVIGFSEVVKNYFKLVKMISDTAEFIKENKIDLVVLMDYPGFNLRLAKKLKKANVKVAYFILPQIWAWGKGRIKKVKKFVDKSFVILPFEEKFYKDKNIPVEFFGHPLLDSAGPTKSREELIKEFKLDASKKTLGLFPGSRRQEIETLLPLMLDVAAGMKDVQMVLCQAPSVDDGLMQKYLAGFSRQIKVVKGRTYDAMAVSDCILAASGTVTLEAAVMGVPAVVVYKVSPVTYQILIRILDLDYVALPNIIAGRMIIPELLQANATKEKVSAEISDILNNKSRREEIIVNIKKVKDSLGNPGVIRKVAKRIMEISENQI